MSQVNHFLKNPINLHIWNPVAKTVNTQTIIGNVPPNIRDALDSHDTATLQAYYGADYARKLALDPLKIGAGPDDDFEAEIAQLLTQKKSTKSDKFAPSRWIYTLSVYPEDNLFTLKEKIQLCTNIPPYRQHIAWRQNNMTHTTYSLFTDTTHYINVFDLESQSSSLDMQLFYNRDSIKVEPHDWFQLAETIIGHDLWIVDLQFYNHQSDIALKTDKFKLANVYYGFVIKYWPILSFQLFSKYIVSESELLDAYRIIYKTNNYLTDKYAKENAIMNQVYDLPINNGYKITALTCKTTLKTIINLVQITRQLHLSDKILQINSYIKIRNRAYLIQRLKYNATPLVTHNKRGITIHIAPHMSCIEPHIFTISHTGEVTMSFNFGELFAITFNEQIATITDLFDQYLSEILSVKTRTTTVEYSEISIIQSLKLSINNKTFYELKKTFENLIYADICNVSTVTKPNELSVLCSKGSHKFDLKHIETIIFAMNEYNIKNLYAILYDQTLKFKWDQQYGGRRLAMIHRTRDIKYEIYGIEYDELQYISQILSWIIGQHEITLATYQSKAPTGNPLRQLLEYDPELFDLKKYDYPVSYCRLCQKTLQPRIYSESDFNMLPKKLQARGVKYKNFTTGEDVYYVCTNDSKPNMRFITGKHPRGYCLPCCGPANEKQLPEVRKSCIETGHYTSSRNLQSTYIMNYGKNIPEHRVARLPIILQNLLSADMHIYGTNSPSSTLASCATIVGKSPQEFVDIAVKHLRNNTSAYDSLLNGDISAAFATFDSFARAVYAKLDNTTIESDRKHFADWPRLWLELLSLHNLNVFAIIDNNGTANNLKLVKIGTYNKSLSTALVLRKSDEYYPLCKLTRIDNIRYIGNPVFIHSHEQIGQTLEKISVISKKNKMVTLEIMLAFAASHGKKITSVYISKSGVAYAIRLDDSYVLPVDYTYDIPRELPVSRDFPDYNSDLPSLLTLITSINDYFNNNNYRSLTIRYFTSHAGKLTSIITTHYPIYLNNLATDNVPAEYQIKEKPYDIIAQMKLIFNAQTVSTLDDYGTALYETYKYKLLLNTIIKHIQLEQNTDIRNKIVTALSNASSMGIRERLRQIVSPTDANRIYTLYLEYPEKIAALISENMFEFDRLTANKIANETPENALALIKNIISELTVDSVPTITQFPNNYVTCPAPQEYCAGPKLRLQNPLKYAPQILSDLTNYLKSQYIYNPLTYNDIIDDMIFESEINEVTSIYNIL